MRLHSKFQRLALCLVLFLLGAGCGGFTASQSISPATFLLPGLMQTEPAISPDPAGAFPDDAPLLSQAQR